MIWRNLNKSSNIKALINRGNILTRYFSGQGFKKNKTQKNFKLKDGSFLFFRGIDDFGRMVKLKLINQNSINKNPILRLSYIEKPNATDFYQIKKGDF